MSSRVVIEHRASLRSSPLTSPRQGGNASDTTPTADSRQMTMTQIKKGSTRQPQASARRGLAGPFALPLDTTGHLPSLPSSFPRNVNSCNFCSCAPGWQLVTQLTILRAWPQPRQPLLLTLSTLIVPLGSRASARAQRKP